MPSGTAPCSRPADVGSPFTGIPNVKVEQKVIQPLSEEEIQALLAVCGAGDEFGCRNRAIILLFLDKGMRYAELHGLTLGDVSWEDRRIHIRHGKGRKQEGGVHQDHDDGHVERRRSEDSSLLLAEEAAAHGLVRGEVRAAGGMIGHA